MQVTLFTILVSAAIWLRSRVDYHKRYILMATVCILANPFVRLPLGIQSQFGILELWTAFALILVFIDTIRLRRLHPAFGWGFTLFLVGMHVGYFVSISQAWSRFATHLVA